MNLASSTILRLFGGDTYLGQSILRYYQSESSYFAVDLIDNREEVEFVQSREGATAIYLSHPSRELLVSPSDYLEASVITLYHRALREIKSGIRHFIFAGSYWQEPKGDGYDPISTYATSKHLSQEILRCLASDDFKVSILHLFDIFGEDDHREKLVSKIFSRGVSKEQSVELHRPNNLVCPVWVKDVIRGIESLDHDARVERSDPFKIYALPGPEVFRVSELLQQTGYKWHVKEANKQHSPETIPRSKHPLPPNWTPSRSFLD